MHDCRQSRIQDNLVLRAGVLQAIRDFFIRTGYLEVETPIRIPAPAPEAYIDALASESWFLHTSPELCMKRLAASGYQKIFQICKCFRKGERGDRHLPELTLLEWYRTDATYEDLMRECETLICQVSKAALGKQCLQYQGHTIDLTPPWERLSVSEAFRRFGSAAMHQALSEDRFEEIMGIEIEPQLGLTKPVFLYDYPAAFAALARRSPADPNLAERFELYIAGIELCNCFTELTDPAEQRRRFEKELKFRKRSGKTVYPMPEPFLSALATMPETAGNALGVDRLVMLLADARAIDDVTAFTPEEL